MKRTFFCIIWAVVFFIIAAVAISMTATQGAKNEQERERLAKQAGEKYALVTLFGPIGLSVVLSVAGVLPGTRRRKRPEATPEPEIVAALAAEPEAVAPVELARFNPAHPSAWSASAPPPRKTSPIAIEGSSEHTFTFGGFTDRWSRIGPAAAVFGVIGLFITSGAMQSRQPAAVLVGAGMLAIGLGILVFLIYRLFTVLEAKLSAEGITWSGVFRPRTRGWDQVASVYRAETITNRRWRVRDLRVEFVGGGSVTFDQSLTDFDSLADQVQRVVGNMMLPRKRAELAQGKAEFGPVTLTPDGIEMRDGFVRQYFTWSDLGRFSILNGYLALFSRPGYRPAAGIGASVLNAVFVDFQRYGKRDGDISVRLSEVPNYLVLLTLMEECGAMRR